MCLFVPLNAWCVFLSPTDYVPENPTLSLSWFNPYYNNYTRQHLTFFLLVFFLFSFCIVLYLLCCSKLSLRRGQHTHATYAPPNII